MKPLILLHLAMLLCAAYAKNMVMRSSRCKLSGGRCVPKADVQRRCVKVGVSCGPTAICCSSRKAKNPPKTGRTTGLKNTKRAKSNTRIKKKKQSKGKRGRRKCLKTPKKCSKTGGSCVSKKKNKCRNKTVDKLCNGGGCTCCLGSCDCGQANEARIVGGEEVSPKHKYPWMVGLAEPDLQYGYFCGGTLINDRYVITAAHCLRSGGALKPKDVKIGLAAYKEIYNEGVTSLVDIKSYTIHKNYDHVTSDEDIALIRLKEPVDLSSNKEIKPVCLPKNKTVTYEGADGIVTGWGLTNYDDYESIPDVLMEVTVPILSPECEGDLPSLVTITENMICAGLEEGGKDACIGDSGGPLVVKKGSTHTLVGIVSFGYGCADPNVPGVYTRVSQYLNWIIENTSDANYCTTKKKKKKKKTKEKLK